MPDKVDTLRQLPLSTSIKVASDESMRLPIPRPSIRLMHQAIHSGSPLVPLILAFAHPPHAQ